MVSFRMLPSGRVGVVQKSRLCISSMEVIGDLDKSNSSGVVVGEARSMGLRGEQDIHQCSELL